MFNQVTDDCFFFCTCSEKLFMQMADHLAGDGFKELGYEFINIDVCCVNSVSSIRKINAQSLTTNNWDTSSPTIASVQLALMRHL